MRRCEELKLLINGQARPTAGPTGLRPVSLRLAANGTRRLRLRAGVAAEAGPRSLVARLPPQRSEVRLLVNGRTVFVGSLARSDWRRPQPTPTNPNPPVSLELTAVDPATLSAAVTVTNALGEPRAAYNQPVGASGYDPVWSNRPVAEVIADILTRHQVELVPLGAAPAAGPAFRVAEVARLPRVAPALNFANLGVGPAMAHIAAAIGGVALWLDPDSRQWRFVRYADGPQRQYRLDQDRRVAAWHVGQSTRRLSAAVELFGPQRLTDTEPVGRRLQWRRASTGGLRPAWDASLEASWTRSRAAWPDPATLPVTATVSEGPIFPGEKPIGIGVGVELTPDQIADMSTNPYQHVYRRWQLTDAGDGQPRPSGSPNCCEPPVALWVRITPMNQPARWEPVSFRWDAARGLVTADVPALSGGLVDLPGAARAAYDVAAAFASPAPDLGPISLMLRLPKEGLSAAAALGVRTVTKRWLPELTPESAASLADTLARQHAPQARPFNFGSLTVIDPDADFWEPGGQVLLSGPSDWGLPSEPLLVEAATRSFEEPLPTWRLRLC